MKKFLMALAVVLPITLGLGVATIGTADATGQHGQVSSARKHHAAKHHAAKHHAAKHHAKKHHARKSHAKKSHVKKRHGHGWSKAQSNAVGSAKSYLRYSSFSRQGLIDQLEYEGYSTSLATFGVNHTGANWYSQAVKSAKSYLNYMSFSHSGLVEQLIYEGFSSAQAEYGVSHNGI